MNAFLKANYRIYRTCLFARPFSLRLFSLSLFPLRSNSFWLRKSTEKLRLNILSFLQYAADSNCTKIALANIPGLTMLPTENIA